MAAVVLRSVVKRFGDRDVLRGIDLEVAAGETLVLIGESGCGKTTTLRLINRLVEPTSGSVEVLGEDLAGVDAPAFRRKIGYVIQDAGLFAHMTVERNVGVVPRLLGWSRGRIRERVRSLLELVGLPPGEFGQRYPFALSGGQRQRVGIARALAADPPIVLLDEPFGALDAVTRERMQDEFASLCRRTGKTFVLVTHDVFEAVRLASRIGVLHKGLLHRVATPLQLMRDRGDPVIDGLIGRHRLQLRGMATFVGAALGPDSSRAVDGSLPIVTPDTSVWDALGECERLGVDAISVAGEPPQVLSRAELVEALGAVGD